MSKFIDASGLTTIWAKIKAYVTSLTAVDSALSAISTNPVQNKVVTDNINGINEDIENLDAVKQEALTAGDNITINGTTISATDTTYDEATTEAAGLMSAADKAALDTASEQAADAVLKSEANDVAYPFALNWTREVASVGSAIPMTIVQTYTTSSSVFSSTQIILGYRNNMPYLDMKAVGRDSANTRRVYIYLGSSARPINITMPGLDTSQVIRSDGTNVSVESLLGISETGTVPKVLATGTVSGTSSAATLSYKSWNGTEITVNYGTDYVFSFTGSDLGISAATDYIVMVTPIGFAGATSYVAKASVRVQTADGFYVRIGGTSATTYGSFSFVMLYTGD